MAVFGIVDSLIFGLMLCISIGIGLYARFTGNRQKSAEDFLLANRSSGIWPVSFSLTASFMSSITLLGVSSEMYQFGTQFFVVNFSYLLATPIAAYLFLPVFYNMKVTSAYEHLEKRFGGYARTAASLAYMIQITLYMGVVLYAPASALQATSGIDKSVAILLVGVTVIIYCCFGGLKAVLLSDVFQACLMFLCVLAIVISGYIYADGFSNIFQAARDGGRLEFWNFDIDPTIRHTWWTLIIGGSFTYLSLYAVNQTQVQRLLSVKSLKDAQKALWYSWPSMIIISGTTCLSGLVIFHYYQKCDPLATGRINARDQYMPIYVIDALSHIPGISGLFISGIFSASLSTISSCLNSLAAVTLEDFVKPSYKVITKKSWESNSAFVSKILAGIFGIICIAVAFIAQSFGGILQAALIIFGVVGGPLLALFTLGMTTTVANQIGSTIGLLIGIMLTLLIGFGKPKPPMRILDVSTEDCTKFGIFNVTQPLKAASHDPAEYFFLYRISYMYGVVLGFLATFLCGYLLSLILRKLNIDNKNIEQHELFLPPIAKRMMKVEKQFIEIRIDDK